MAVAHVVVWAVALAAHMTTVQRRKRSDRHMKAGDTMDTMDTNDSSTWQILRYHFPNESEVDEFYNDWWQVLRNGTPELSGVDLNRAKSHVTAHAAGNDIVQYAGREWTGNTWRVVR